MKPTMQCGTSAGPQFLREAGFFMIAGCQVSTVVLRIRDDGPALVDDDPAFPSQGMATARLEPQA